MRRSISPTSGAARDAASPRAGGSDNPRHMHHIATDVWSMGVLVKEMMALYKAFSEGRPSPSPEPPIQYADYAMWQHEWSQQSELTKQLEYWKQRLNGAPSALDLPIDRPRAGSAQFAGAVQKSRPRRNSRRR